MNQGDLFRLKKRVTDDAVGRALDHAEEEWKRHARNAVLLLATQRPEFTTDDVWEILGAGGTHEPRALGGVMRDAARQGLIEATDRTRKSTRTICHRRPQMVWRSLKLPHRGP